MTADRPLTGAELERLRLIIGDTPDVVMQAADWCRANGARIAFEDARCVAVRDGEIIATGHDLDLLVSKLEKLEP